MIRDMTQQQSKELLESLGLTTSEAVVYSALANGVTQVKDIMQQTGMKRPSVYYALSKLETRGLIGRMQVGEYNRWKLDDPNRLIQLVEEKTATIDALKKDTADFVQQLSDIQIERDGAKVTYFEGQKAIESVVFNSLYCKGKEILSIAPQGNFFQQTGRDFARKFVAERKKRGITTKHLWEAPVDQETIDQYYTGVSTIRYVPKSMEGKFRTTIFIYDDTVMYIAPQESNNAVIFHSTDHANMQRAIFETIWNVSK